MLPRVLRRETFELALKIKCPHIAPSLSTCEALIAVYNSMTSRDKFILSKGHGCVAWYVILRLLGKNPPLRHHPDIDVANGVECTTGSLGHGLPMAVGMALAKKLNKEPGVVYVMLGDGECEEGTTWESAMIASALKLDNLCVIVDRNGLQTLGSPDVICNLGDLANKFCAFDWCAWSVNGHSVADITDVIFKHTYGPKAIVANTVKGYGISYMENNPIFHSRLPNDEEIEIARRELA